ncbi:hypothetical protein [Marispirochaeta aestuarii]|uniref:hypothetical protein n=1 Tax=Marispirochaeta aestuarii TaxID=1963862 RepID=UPI0029C6AE01|nr:hypothetical protein [Marispirochaeta aestuarii]
MISGLRRIRKISHQAATQEETGTGFSSRFFTGVGNTPLLFHLEECHHYRIPFKNPGERLPFTRQPGETTVTYLLCGSLKFTTSGGIQESMSPGSCLWISSTGEKDVEFESTTPPSQEFWSVHVRASGSPGFERVPPLSCQIRDAIIPMHRGEDGIIVRVIAGEYEGLRGPLYAQSGAVLFLDVSIPPLTPLNISIPGRFLVLLYCLEGSGLRDFSSGSIIQSSELIRYSRGEEISLSTETEEVRLLLIGGTGTALTEL